MISRKDFKLLFSHTGDGSPMDGLPYIFSDYQSSGYSLRVDTWPSFPWAYYASRGEDLLGRWCMRGKEADMFAVNTGNATFALGVLGMLSTSLCIGLDLGQGTPEVGYYTTSPFILSALLKANAFVDPEKCKARMDELFTPKDASKSDIGPKFASNFKKGSIPMVRLDVKQASSKGLLFDIVAPRDTGVRVGTSFFVLPAFYYAMVGNGFMTLMNSAAFELDSLVFGHPESVKSRLVTSSPEFVDLFYRNLGSKVGKLSDYQEACDRHIANAYDRGFTSGFDPAKLQWYVFNLGSSLYGSPVSVVKPELVLRCHMVMDPYSVVDTSDLFYDPAAIRRLFERRVRNWTRVELTQCVPDSAALPTVKQARDYVLKLFDDVEPADLSKFMRHFSAYFSKGNIEDDLARETSRIQNILNGCSKVPGPYTVRDLRDVLAGGPVKVVARSKKTGSLREYVVTNNAELLERMYGPIRYLGYENPRKAFSVLIEMVKAGEIQTFNSFLNRVTAAGVDGLIDFSKVPEDAYCPVEWEAALKAAEADYLAEREGKKKAEPNPNIVSFRSLLATHRGNYFASVDIDTVLEVWA